MPNTNYYNLMYTRLLCFLNMTILEKHLCREVLQVYDSYNLVRDDTEAINELGVWPNKKDIAQSVATKAKSALTRALNKEKRLLPYAQANTVVKGRRKGGAATVGGQFLSTL